MTPEPQGFTLFSVLDGLLHAPDSELAEIVEHFDFAVVPSTPRIGSLFRVHVIPLIVVLDRDGRVAYAHSGELNTRDEVDHLLTAVRRTDARYAVASMGNNDESEDQDRDGDDGGGGRAGGRLRAGAELQQSGQRLPRARALQVRCASVRRVLLRAVM